MTYVRNRCGLVVLIRLTSRNWKYLVALSNLKIITMVSYETRRGKNKVYIQDAQKFGLGKPLSSGGATLLLPAGTGS